MKEVKPNNKRQPAAGSRLKRRTIEPTISASSSFSVGLSRSIVGRDGGFGIPKTVRPGTIPERTASEPSRLARPVQGPGARKSPHYEHALRPSALIQSEPQKPRNPLVTPGEKILPHKVPTLMTQERAMNSRLERIQDWETLTKDAVYNPATMAALCPISLRQLQRFFRLHFGKSPNSWAMELRCRRARELVARGYSNKGVAAELNFASESHFCHAFKKVYGCPPQSFAPLYGRVSRSEARISHSDKCPKQALVTPLAQAASKIIRH